MRVRELVEDVRCAVRRQVVHHDEGIDALVRMKADIVSDDVFLVADQKGHHQLDVVAHGSISENPEEPASARHSPAPSRASLPGV